MTFQSSRSLPAFVLGTLIFALDQAAKYLVLERLEWGRSIEIVPNFFNITLIRNTGAAWGILHNYGFWLMLLAIVALIFLFHFRRHFTHVGLLPRIALGLLLGGISGNLMDRLLYGYVVDFLSFHMGRFQWPAFNVADSAICIGVGLYLLDSFKHKS